ncbi:MAG: hypothetical protein IIU73_04685 [Selenomonadales bacterium]|nr:hypothetical protein [Selenomonadales bacterium]
MITATTKGDYTWDTALFAWDDGTAVKTWDTASLTDYLLAEEEQLTVRRTDARTPHITNRQTVHLGTAHTKRTVCHMATAIPLTERADRTTAYRRTASETASLTANSGRHLARTARSAAHLTDTALSPWQGILANITLLESGLDDTSWARLSASPSGYEAFHPFEVGEYTYRDALVRLLLTTGAAGADPLLYDVAFHVDIEDTRESGIADCTASAPTRITLAHHYYRPPRIVLTVLSADTADGMPIPHLISQGETDGARTFDCELRLANGTRKSGTVSWLAEGY